MFDRIFDFVESVIGWFIFWVVIDQYERGVVLTFGKFRGRELGPGLHLCWPFGIDEALVDNVVRAPLELNAQNLVSADGQNVLICLVVTWEITDIQMILLKTEGGESVVEEVIKGVIGKAVREYDWERIRSNRFVTLLRQRIQRKAGQLGVNVIDCEISELTNKSRVFRLLND
jgi:regulator of protease activity HflC (stomatin/prohibitin superfamily)